MQNSYRVVGTEAGCREGSNGLVLNKLLSISEPGFVGVARP
jgi:hypothetical protein